MRRPTKLIESVCWTVDVDEETGQHFWRGGELLGKEETIFNIGCPLIVNPDDFPPGTHLTVSEPWDPAFYARLFDKHFLDRGVDSEDTGSGSNVDS